MPRYSDIVTTEQDNPNIPPVPIVGASVYVTKPDGSLEVLTHDDGSEYAQPAITAFDGALIFNVPAPGAVYTLQYRYGGRLIRESQIIIGNPPQFKGDPGAGPGGSIGPFSSIANITVPAGVRSFLVDDGGLLFENPALTDANVAAYPNAIAKDKAGRYFQRDWKQGLWFEWFNPPRTVNIATLGTPAYLNEPDASPAVQAMHDYAVFVGAPDPFGNGALVAPVFRKGFGIHRLASPINFKITAQWIGAGGNHELSRRVSGFVTDRSGFLFNRRDTYNLAPAALTTGADGWVMRGLYLGYAFGRGNWNAIANSPLDQFGVHTACEGTILESCVEGYYQGFAIDASVGSGGIMYGEASMWEASRNSFNGCYIAVNISGTDANLGVCQQNTINASSLIGINDNSLLANGFRDNHYKNNCLSDEFGVSIVTESGGRWYPNPNATQDQLANNQPSLSPQYWAYLEPAYTVPSFQFPEWPVDFNNRPVGGKKFKQIATPVRHAVPGSSSRFEGEYLEGSQPLPTISSPAYSIGGGGVWRNSVFATAPFLQVPAPGTMATQTWQAQRQGGPNATQIDADRGLTLFGTPDPFGYSLSPYGNDYRWTSGNADAYAFVTITGRTTTQTFGRATPQPFFWNFDPLILGGRAIFRCTGGSPPAPVNGNRAPGEIAIRTDFVSGQPWGYGVSPDGTTWKPLGVVP